MYIDEVAQLQQQQVVMVRLLIGILFGTYYFNIILFKILTFQNLF